MKKFLVSAVLPLLICGAVRADVGEVKPAEAKIAIEDARLKSAIKSVWIKDLKQPQGMAWLGDTLYVAEYGGGQVSKWSREGKPLGAITGLKSPAWVERIAPLRLAKPGQELDLTVKPDEIWISERKANRVVRLLENGEIQPVGEAIEEPLGLTSNNGISVAIAHTTSRVLRWDGVKWILLFAPEGDGARYGYRNVVVDDDGTVFLSDEEEGEILAITQGGRAFVIARGLKEPAAIVIGPDKALYVAEEGAGRIVRLNRDGSNTPVIDGLGTPRDIEFLDAKTLLVSDKKGGVIWKVVWP